MTISGIENVIGTTANDIFYDGAGDNVFIGGDGSDVFVFDHDAGRLPIHL